MACSVQDDGGIFRCILSQAFRPIAAADVLLTMRGMATLYRGRVRMSVPIIYLTGFFILFVFGGLTGVILANPTLDYQVHNSQFLVAHFHNMLIPGTLFGVFAGIHCWFPKAFGFRLDERPGRRTAYLWFAGFCLAFLPLYWLGLIGMPRRSASYVDPAFQPAMILALIGALLLLAALVAMIRTVRHSVKHRADLACPIGDPWDGRSLEWAVPAPAPDWNFDATPQVRALDPFTIEKAEGTPYCPAESYEDISVPRNTAMGLSLALLSGIMGFALVWWIWWLAALSLACIVGVVIARAFAADTEVTIPVARLKRAHEAFIRRAARTPAVGRDDEATPHNRGRADPEVPA